MKRGNRLNKESLYKLACISSMMESGTVNKVSFGKVKKKYLKLEGSSSLLM